MYREKFHLTDNQLKKSIRSFDNQIAKHENLLKDPARYLREYGKETKGPWHTLQLEERTALLEKRWPDEIKNFYEKRNIVEEILNARK